MIDRENILAAVLIFATVALCYAGVTGAGFVWDDEYLVAQNPLVRAPLLSLAPFKQDIVNSSFTTTIYYRPVQIFSYALDYRLWGMKPLGFHLTNVLLHFFNALLVFAFTRKITGGKAAALLTAVLFASHPAHAGAVAYVSGRAELLFFFFGFAYMILFLLFREKKAYVLLAASMAALALALLSKEGAVIFPVLALLADVVMRKRRRVTDLAWHLPAFAVAISYLFIHHMAFGARYAMITGGAGLTAVISKYATLAGSFLTLSFNPFGMHMRRAGEAPAAAALLIAAACLAAIIFLRKERKALLFSSAFFAAAIVPFVFVTGYFRVVGEHWMYLASYGVFLFMAAAFVGIYSAAAAPARKVIVIALFSLVMLYSLGTVEQNRYWIDSMSLSDRVLSFSGSDVPAMHFKAVAFIKGGAPEEAKEAIRHYAEQDPGDPRSWYVKGRIMLASGDKEAAAADFRRAITADKRYGGAYFGLALVALMDNDPEEALRFLGKAVEINPRDSDALLMMGTVYSEKGDNTKALEFTERAYRSNPYDYRTIVNMGTVHARMGKTRESARYYLEASERYPEKPIPYYNLGHIFYLDGQKEEAEKWLIRALKADPQFKPAAELLEKMKSEKDPRP